MNKKPWKRRLLLQLTLVCTVVLLAYMLYLDAQIKQRFSGSIWQVPAQVYARSLVLEVDREITKKEVTDELKLLGYRRTSDLEKSGSYYFTQNSLVLFKRAFHFPTGYEPARRVKIAWNGNRIVDIADLSNQQTLRTISLEPWLVSRLVSTNRQDRMLLDKQQIPDILIDALTLTEDRDFYSHHGVAPLAIVRALAANVAAGKTVQGGSTLTQQLVKNVFLTRERSLSRKAKEALMALVIDARYSKERIMCAYLNEVYLGQNGDMAIHGFGLAAHYYFDRPLNELDVPELALLVGMVKGPSYYNPLRHPERTIERRNLVLRILLEHNKITADDYRAMVEAPPKLNTSGNLASGQHPAFMDKVRRELADILAEPSLRESGVKVFTTLDVNAQRRAEQALTRTLDRQQKDRQVPLNAAMMVTDIQSGGIRAIVGSRRTDFRGFNRALDAYRPVGSLVKPVVYLSALENPVEYNLASPLVDMPLSLPDKDGLQWQPQNADKTFREQVPMITALVDSLNVPTVRLGMEIGLDVITDNLKRMGVTSPIPQVPSITLGALSLNLLQVSQVYQSLANSGLYTPLHAVEAIVSPSNRLLWLRDNYTEQVANEDAAYLVNYALHQVTQTGTAKAVGRQFGNVFMAGKTGTTNDYRDSWFAGFDRSTLTTVWVGNDDNEPVNLSGTSGAMPVFQAYQALQEPKSLSRRFPDTLSIAHFDKTTGRPIVPGCQNILSVPAIIDVLPPPVKDCLGRPVERKKRQSEKSWWERLLGM
ncbi:penicillin-binding protein 1B [Alteromonas sediminis]|uniref:Penicillin-binding protein 1B n=1 Tax=Alteromonas sediminis TaxID=2259342 RepID=A0A3N5XZC3_9ALTE|nr:penicillin-binding protein 1B [Alteromonas sediminis]RPJ66402.1 penicillin-binding protein 1B [Alteromonas sediminis]